MRLRVALGFGLVLALAAAYLTRSKPVPAPETPPHAEAAPETLPAAPAPNPRRATLPTPPSPGPSAATKPEETEPKDPNVVLLEKVGALVDSGKTGDAVAILEKTLESDPENFSVAAELGFIHSRLLGKKEKAKEYFQQALRKNAESGEALHEVVDIYAGEKNFKKAHAFLNELAEKFPDNHKIVLAQGELHEREGNLPAALADAERASAIPGATSEAFDNLAHTQHVNGLTEEAKDSYRHSVEEKALEQAKSPAPSTP